MRKPTFLVGRWPTFYTLKEYVRHYNIAMRVIHITTFLLQAVLSLIVMWYVLTLYLNNEQIELKYLLIGTAISIHSLLQLPFIIVVLRTLKK